MTSAEPTPYCRAVMAEPISLSRQIEEIVRGVHKGVNVLVVGPSGSGRRTLFAELKQQYPQGLAIDLLPLHEVDAPSVAILEALSALHLEHKRIDDADSIYEAAREVAHQLESSHERPLILRVPRDWAMIARQDEVDDPTLSQANSLLRGLTSTRSTVVIVADEHFDRRNVVLGAMRTVVLPARELSLAQMDLREDWGPLQHAAATLRDHALTASPVLLRLAIGAVAAGIAPSTAVEWAQHGNVEALAKPVIAKVLGVPGGAECVGALSVLRTVVSLDSIRAILPADPTATALVAQCLGYGGERFRISDEVLAMLRERCKPSERHHSAVAAVHRALDGASEPSTIRSQSTMRHWAEKVHHLGAAGSLADREWSEQTFPSPAFHWDRARAFSLKGQFARAAEAYRACVARFPDDDYGWHYLGFNLERSVGDAAEIERAYRRAVELAPNKAWWTGRLVSFLIKRRDFDAARRVWTTALPNLVHDRRLCTDPILAMQLHRWVARDWLEADQIEDARHTIASIDRAVVERESDLRAIARDIVVALFLAHGPSTLDARAALAKELSSLSRERPWLPFPAIEAVDEGLRMSWDNGVALAQIDFEDGFEVEWYARDHRTSESEAGVGRESLSRLSPWLQRASTQ